MQGTFNGGTCKFEGTANPTDGATVYPLHDGQGNDLDFTVAKMEEVLVNAYQYKPVITAGAGMLLDCYILGIGR